MKDLKEISGIPVKLEDIGLVFDQEIFPTEPAVRTYAEAQKAYLYQKAKGQDLYLMYRYFESEDDGPKFEAAGLEYDLTAIKPGLIGQEFIKTVGHFHGIVPDTDLTYPEVYEVISGEAEYLLQTKPDSENQVDVVIIEAKPKDKIIVPPGYGHVTINPGSDWLVAANIQKRNLPATSDYSLFTEHGGAALYHTKNGWENNKKYVIKSVKRVRPKPKPEWGLSTERPLYISCVQEPEKFKFLTSPQYFSFSDVWEEVKR